MEGAALLAGEAASGRAGVAERFFVGLRLEVGRFEADALQLAHGVQHGLVLGLDGDDVLALGLGAEDTDARAAAALGAPFAIGMLPASAGRLAISASSSRRPQSRAAWS